MKEAHWTKQFEEGETSSGDFSVLADWPFPRPRYDRSNDDNNPRLFLDQTAILTLGVLGPDIAEQILTALGTCYIHVDLMEELHQDQIRIGAHLQEPKFASYRKAVDFFREHRTIVDYSEDIDSAAPNGNNLGPCRVDLGVASLRNALYIKDLDNSEDWPDEANRLRISSATLLASLNNEGVISVDVAKKATEIHPHIFEGWDTSTPQATPEALVFNEFSILNWVDTGLVNFLGNRVKIGPWAWKYIYQQFEQYEVMELANKRLNDMRRVLQGALDKDFLVKIQEKVDSGTLRKKTVKSENDADSHTDLFWQNALRSLQTAQSHGLQLWADDRFYILLLSVAGGPKLFVPESEAISTSFFPWAKEMPPISTVDLLDQLSTSGSLSSIIAQNAAQNLFLKGYRTAHSLLIAYALRQYPLPPLGELSSPFQKLVDTITEIPHYLSENFNEIYGNRNGCIRVASMGVAKQFIVGVWKDGAGLRVDQRYALADAFLEATEQVFKEANPTNSYVRSDPTPFSFWQGIAYSLQMMDTENEDSAELHFTALLWLGRAAASRVKWRKEIVQILEDNVLDSLKYALRTFEKSTQEYDLRQIIAIFIVRPFIPLTDTKFQGILNPLMRRTVSTLAGITGGGYVTWNYNYTAGEKEIQLSYSEEENEKASAEILKRFILGDLQDSQIIRGTDLVFSYSRPVPQEWIDKGLPPDEQIDVKVRCSLFTLLLDGPPVLHENIIRILINHLSGIDPALAYQILLAENDILGDDSERKKNSRHRLGVELLRSAYFDLRRDLVHAIQRFRQYDTRTLTQFLGWVGEDVAQVLANHSTKPKVWPLGNLLVPKSHLLARALLTEKFDDGALIHNYIDQLINSNNGQDHENAIFSTLTEFLEDKVFIAENYDDPFVAAWALRLVLLVLTKVNQKIEININGSVVEISDWVINHLRLVLAPDINQPSEIQQRMIDRCRLSSSTLLLSTFICSGHKHLEAFSQGDDPYALWLEHVWLMGTKLHIALICQRGGLSDAAEASARAVRELELDTSGASIVDAFDPFAFAPNGDDIGIALTLTAMLKVVCQLSDKERAPIWWTNSICNLVEELAGAGNDEISASGEEIDNRLGLATPLRVQVIAQQLRVFFTT